MILPGAFAKHLYHTNHHEIALALINTFPGITRSALRGGGPGQRQAGPWVVPDAGVSSIRKAGWSLVRRRHMVARAGAGEVEGLE